MIVKRMVESLRRQDWTMVAIEFMLVVVGVLLGFQINDWGAERSQAAVRHEASERLLEEAERDVAYIRQATDYERHNVETLRSLLLGEAVALRPAGDGSPLSERLVSVRSMVALAPPSSVYDDIVSSGELSRIGNEEVRAAVGRFRSTLSFEERMRLQLQTILPAYERLDAFNYRLDPNGRLAVDVDFAAIDRDKDARKIIAIAAENHRILLMLRTRALRDSEGMCLALGSVVGRPCNLRLPPPKF